MISQMFEIGDFGLKAVKHYWRVITIYCRKPKPTQSKVIQLKPKR